MSSRYGMSQAHGFIVDQDTRAPKMVLARQYIFIENAYLNWLVVHNGICMILNKCSLKMTLHLEFHL